MPRKIITSLLILLGLFVVVEVGLRLALGLGSPPLLQKDERIGYLLQPDQHLTRFGNRVAINEYHQRSESLSTRPDSTFARVLFIGDSVTMGGMLTDQDQTYPELFEQQAARVCTRPVEALNASVGSWGIGNLRAYVEQFGTFGSDLVVLQIGSGDLLQAKSSSEEVGRHPAKPNRAPLLAVQELWSRYLWPRYLAPHLPAFLKPSRPSAQSREKPEPAQRFAQNMTWLRQLIGTLRKADQPVLVVHTPDRFEVVQSGTDGRADYRRRFASLLDSLQVPTLMMKDRWQGRSDAASLYRDPVHFNEQGNAQLAEDLWSFVQQRWDPCAL